MKFLPLVIFLQSIYFTCSSQSIIKTYYGNDSLEFIEFIDQKKMRFIIHEEGGFGGMYHAGQGLYQLKNNKRLVVKVMMHDKTLESTYEILKDSTVNSGTIIKGHIVNENGEPLGGVTMTFTVGNKIDGLISNMDGFFYKEINAPRIYDLSATYIGYSKCIIAPNNSKLTEYLIKMKEPFYNFLDHHILIAKISLNDDSNKFIIKRLKIKKTGYNTDSIGNCKFSSPDSLVISFISLCVQNLTHL